MPDFTGELGGILASAWIAGIATGWGLCMKIRVTPLTSHTDKLEAKLDELRGKIEQQFWGGR